jgi:hypothetical protein
VGVCVDTPAMHTHFGSATHLLSTFLGVLVAGAFWRLGWMHVLAWGQRKGNRHAQGFAKAALVQY